jgi:O-methyltransferase
VVALPDLDASTTMRPAADTGTGTMNRAAELYIELLKKVLANTLFHDEPDVAEAQHRFVPAFVKHYIKGPAMTMLPRARLENIQHCVAQVIADGVPGDLIETGVWRGGATILMRALLEVYGETGRTVWVADSFEGLPEPDAKKFPLEAQSYHGATVAKQYDRFAASLETVQENFRALSLLDERVRFLKGWFKDTLPSAPIGRIAVMRLDGDYYESTIDVLTALYDKLSVGGFVIIDDYAEDAWTYCRRAVDEFRASRGVTEELVPVDLRCWYWRRST